jgi:hypothetical protein
LHAKANDLEAAARERVTRIEADLKDVSADAKARAEFVRERLDRSAQEAADYRRKLQVSEANLEAQTREHQTGRAPT